jgi:hypothetical protein
MDKDQKMYKKIFTLIISLFCISVQSLTLSEFYKVPDENKIWYLGGVFDTMIMNPSTSNCIKKLKLDGFANKIAFFVQSLPVDPLSKERIVYDNLNVSAIALLVIEKHCSNEK